MNFRLKVTGLPPSIPLAYRADKTGEGRFVDRQVTTNVLGELDVTDPINAAPGEQVTVSVELEAVGTFIVNGQPVAPPKIGNTFSLNVENPPPDLSGASWDTAEIN